MAANLTETARCLAAGLTDPVALTEQALEAATASGFAFLAVMRERALFEAEQSRGRWKRGLPLSRWDGLPVSWKDLFDMAGERTTAGSQTLTGSAPARRDAAVVRRAARAGLVSIGRTNLSEFAFSGLGVNPHFGTPAGLLGRDGAARVPGGSSSGAASAMLAGAGLVAIGTDTAGSVRVPAAFTGMVGFRPSLDRYPMDGVFPLAPSFDTFGPIGRTVADCAAMDIILAGDPDRVLEPIALERAAFVVDGPLLEALGTEPAVRNNLLHLIELLRQKGARVTVENVATLREVENILDTLGWLGGVEAFNLHRERLAGADRSLIDHRVVTRLERARDTAPDAVAELYAQKRILPRRLEQDLDGAILLYPTVPHVAPPLAPLLADDDLFAQTNLRTLRSTMLMSFLGAPGIALPTGADDQDLPTSVLLSAPAGQDEKLLRVGLAVEHVLRIMAAD
jgi:aspartyl-tRNA(Asn)/glutamyl-tRNA(Gln) amidotransferase subunit A